MTEITPSWHDMIIIHFSVNVPYGIERRQNFRPFGVPSIIDITNATD